MADDMRFVLEVPGQAAQPVSPQRTASAKTQDWPAGTAISTLARIAGTLSIR